VVAHRPPRRKLHNSPEKMNMAASVLPRFQILLREKGEVCILEREGKWIYEEINRATIFIGLLNRFIFNEPDFFSL